MSTKAEQDIEYLIQKEEEGTLTRAEKTRLVRLLTLKKGREKRSATAQAKKKEQDEKYTVEEPQTESENESEDDEPEEEEPQEELPKPKLKRNITKARKPATRANTPADSTFPMQIYEQLARQELMIKRLMKKKKPDGIDKKTIEKIPETPQKTAPVEAKSESIIQQTQKAPDPEKVQALRKKILF